MSVTSLNPPQEDLAKFGPLAYVSEQDRERILALPFGQFKPAIKRLEKEIKERKAQEKERLNREKLFSHITV